MATTATFPICSFHEGSSTTPGRFLPAYVCGPGTRPATLEDDPAATDAYEIILAKGDKRPTGSSAYSGDNFGARCCPRFGGTDRNEHDSRLNR